MPDKEPRAGRLLSFLHQHRQQWQKAPLPLPFLSVLALLPPSSRHRLLCQAPHKAPQNADLGGIDTLPSPFCRMVHDPEKRSKNTPFPPSNSEILGALGKLCPQTPLYSLRSQTATIQLAGFRNNNNNHNYTIMISNHNLIWYAMIIYNQHNGREGNRKPTSVSLVKKDERVNPI